MGDGPGAVALRALQSRCKAVLSLWVMICERDDLMCQP